MESLHFDDSSTLAYARTEFNKNRNLIIKNIPPVTYEEVKEFMGGFAVSNITISKKCRHAIVTLVHGEEAEEAIRMLSQRQLLGTDVEVSLCSNENMLCITHLPLSLSEDEFRKELEPFGPIEKCLLMQSTLTGCNKGYGFVEFAHNRMKSARACQILNGHKIGSVVIHCSFLHPSVLRFEDLHSVCLLVENLPPEYANGQELKNICSVIAEPESYQLDPEHRLAVIQYKTVEEAESTQQEINSHIIDTHKIMVSFCGPGESIPDLCSNAVNNQAKEEQLCKPPPPLMPPDGQVVHPVLDPTKLASPVVKKLLAENPEALEKFTDLLGMLQTQILQEQEKLQPGIMGPAPWLPAGPLLNPNLQIALLSVMIAQQIQYSKPDFVQEPTTQTYILDSLERHQQHQPARQNIKSPSMGSPLVSQANSLLMNAINNTDSQLLDNTNANAVKPPFALFPGPEKESLSTSCLRDFNHLVTALTPKTTNRESSRLTKMNVTEVKRETTTDSTTESKILDGPQSVQNPFFNLPGVSYANPFLASFIEQQIKLQVQQNNQPVEKPVSLLDLPLRNRNIPGPLNMAGNFGFPNARNPGVQGKQSILGEAPMMQPQSILGNYPPTPTSWNKPPSLLGANYMTEKRTLSFEDVRVPLKRRANSQPQSLLGEPPASMARNYSQPTADYGASSARSQPVEPLCRPGQVASLMDLDLSTPAHPPQNVASSGGQYGNLCAEDVSGVGHTEQSQSDFIINSQNYYKQGMSQGNGQHVQSEISHHVDGRTDALNYQYNIENFQQTTEGQSDRRVVQMMSNQPQSLMTDRTLNGPSLMDNIHPRKAVPSLFAHLGQAPTNGVRPLISHEKPASCDQPFTAFSSGNGMKSGSNKIPSLLSANFSQDSILGKAKPHLVPSPEASPDSVYVGQHSQGLGGHYAANYFNR